MQQDRQSISEYLSRLPLAGGESEDTDSTLALAGHVLDGGIWGDAYGFSESDYEALYALARTLYGQARYAEAQPIFTWLFKYNQFDRRFPLGLAATLHMLGKHGRALEYYAISAFMDMEDPMPMFHGIECLLAMGRLEEAMRGLHLVIEQCATSNRDALRARSEGLRDLILTQRGEQQEVQHA